VRDGRRIEVTARKGGPDPVEHTVRFHEPVGENPVGNDGALRELVSILSRTTRKQLLAEARSG
jgi:hypothetical protein